MVTLAVRVSGAAFVAATGWSGSAVGGTAAGFIAAAAAVGALWLSIRTANRARQREYEQEIDDAHDRGVLETERRLTPEIGRRDDEIKRLVDDRNNWRQQAQRRRDDE